MKSDFPCHFMALPAIQLLVSKTKYRKEEAKEHVASTTLGSKILGFSLSKEIDFFHRDCLSINYVYESIKIHFCV